MGIITSFAKITGAAYVFSSDHGLKSGYDYNGGEGLNADSDGHWGISTSRPFIRKEGIAGPEANDYHMASPNHRHALEVYNLRILSDGRFVFNRTDDIPSENRSKR